MFGTPTSLSELADRLIENLETTQDSITSRLFTRPPIIVPNRNIETYLKYEIARGAGIAAGLKFQMTEEFLADLLRQTHVDHPRKLVNGNALRAFFIDILSEESGSSAGSTGLLCRTISPRVAMTEMPAT